jgi:SAM-dependent methyltransferase
MLNFMKLLGGEDDPDDGPDDARTPREGRHDPYAPRQGGDDPHAPRHGRDGPYAPRDSRGEPLEGYEPPPPRPRRSMTDSATWDEFWTDQMTSGVAGFVDLFCRDGRLIDAMRANRFKTILCVGSGISQEPKALGLAGFDVTVLDISPLAIKVAQEWDVPDEILHKLIEGRQAGRRRRIRFVTGDLLDASLCPGPFDVVLERKTLQLYSDEDRPAAMRALAARLATPGIFFSHSHRNFASSVSREDDPSAWFHAEQWPLWQSAKPIQTRVAWLSSSSG